jgi:hypothetical protein
MNTSWLQAILTSCGHAARIGSHASHDAVTMHDTRIVQTEDPGVPTFLHSPPPSSAPVTWL